MKDTRMRFSIARLLALLTIISLFLGLTFAVPYPLGFTIQAAISLFVFPPMLIVGVVNTRGVKQAFFLGCMFAGILHFVFSCWSMVNCAFASPQDFVGDWDSGFIRYLHLFGIAAGLIGGLSGMAAFRFLVSDSTDSADFSAIK